MVVEREVAGRTLRARVAPRNERRAGSALTAFDRLGRPEPGAQLRFGWSALRLEPEEGGALLACEPDFSAWPQRGWTDTIDVTIDVLEAQVELLRRTGADGEDIAFEQVVLAAPGTIDEPSAFLRRVEAIGAQDSGWLVGALDDPEGLTRAEELEPVPIAALVTRRRSLLQTLALPVGYIAIVDGETVAQVLDAAGRERL